MISQRADTCKNNTNTVADTLNEKYFNIFSEQVTFTYA